MPLMRSTSAVTRRPGARARGPPVRPGDQLRRALAPTAVCAPRGRCCRRSRRGRRGAPVARPRRHRAVRACGGRRAPARRPRRGPPADGGRGRLRPRSPIVPAAAVSSRIGAAMRQAISPPSAEPTGSATAAMFHRARAAPRQRLERDGARLLDPDLECEPVQALERRQPAIDHQPVGVGADRRTDARRAAPRPLRRASASPGDRRRR